VAAVLFAVAFGTNVPTPLLIIYRRDLDLSATTITAVFGVYAAGLLPALFLAGPASDRVGRKRVVLPFAVLALATSLLFVRASGSVPLLFLSRFLQGIVAGAVFSVGSAWLQDVCGPAATAAASRRASVALNGGFALGPLTAGLLATYLPAPTTLPFLVHAVLAAAGVLVALRTPDAVRHPAAATRIRGLGLPPLQRRRFWLVTAPGAVCVFGFPAVGITVLPLLLGSSGGAVAFTGLLAGLTLGCAALASPFARGRARPAPLGAALGALGLAVGAAGTPDRALLLVPAAVLLGSGAGLVLTAGLEVVQRLSTPATRGRLNAVFYAFAYLGFGIPVLLTALARGHRPVVELLVLAVATTLLAGWMYVGSRAPGRHAAGALA